MSQIRVLVNYINSTDDAGNILRTLQAKGYHIRKAERVTTRPKPGEVEVVAWEYGYITCITSEPLWDCEMQPDGSGYYLTSPYGDYHRPAPPDPEYTEPMPHNTSAAVRAAHYMLKHGCSANAACRAVPGAYPQNMAKTLRRMRARGEI